MKNITLQSIHLRQFKGIADFAIELNGESVHIYGENDAGKSTIADAYLWLLTGKNNLGETFDPFPRDNAGNRQHDGMEPTVECRFASGSNSFTLKRSLVEKRTKKTGQTEAIYTGDESKCWIDGVPKKVTEYGAFVEQTFAEESVLRLLTNIGYFMTQIKKTDDRRALLFSTFGDLPDADILASTPELAPLAAEIDGRSVADFHKMKAAELKEACQELDRLPIRIDEAAKSLSEGIDIEKVKDSISKLTVELSMLRYDIANDKDDPAAALRQERKSVEHQKNRVFIEWEEHENTRRFEHESKHKEQLRSAETALSDAGYRCQELKTTIERGNRRIAELELEMQARRDEWAREDRTEFIYDEECPTCGQPFPADTLEEMRGNWNEQKSGRLSRITGQGKELAAEKDKCALAVEGLAAKLDAAEAAKQKAETQLQAIKDAATPYQPDPEALQKHQAALAKYDGELARLDKQLAAAAQGGHPELESKKKRIAELDERLADYQVLKAKWDANTKAQQRIDGYSAEQQRLGVVRDAAAHLIQLCEDFIRIKAEKITDNINQKFSIVRFILFEQLKNGGLKGICNCAVDGVEYAQLNSAKQLAANLDIIETFGKALSCCFPVFIDNAESCIKDYGITSEMQTIRLYVSENDKELRVEGDTNHV